MTIKEKLITHIKKEAGTYDEVLTSGKYGLSYNDRIGYAGVYYINSNGEISSLFMGSSEVVYENLGKNFFEVADITKIKKIKNFINYML